MLPAGRVSTAPSVLVVSNVVGCFCRLRNRDQMKLNAMRIMRSISACGKFGFVFFACPLFYPDVAQASNKNIPKPKPTQSWFDLRSMRRTEWWGTTWANLLSVPVLFLSRPHFELKVDRFDIRNKIGKVCAEEIRCGHFVKINELIK